MREGEAQRRLPRGRAPQGQSDGWGGGGGGGAPAKRARGEGAGATMLDAEDWENLRTLYDSRGEARELALRGAREMQRDAKRAICALHRGDLEAAESLLEKAGGPGSKVSVFFASCESTSRGGETFSPGQGAGPLLPETGEHVAEALRQPLRPQWGGAMEEYAEAWLFLRFLQRGGRALAPRSALAESSPAGKLVNDSEYLGGVLDFCGEMNRWAVRRAAERDLGAVTHCRDLALAIQEELLQFDFRNGELRRKFDALKYTVRNLERVLYDLALSPREPAPREPVPAPARSHE